MPSQCHARTPIGGLRLCTRDTRSSRTIFFSTARLYTPGISRNPRRISARVRRKLKNSRRRKEYSARTVKNMSGSLPKQYPSLCSKQTRLSPIAPGHVAMAREHISTPLDSSSQADQFPSKRLGAKATRIRLRRHAQILCSVLRTPYCRRSRCLPDCHREDGRVTHCPLPPYSKVRGSMNPVYSWCIRLCRNSSCFSVG